MDYGMVGPGELYYQVKINDPLYYPIIEKLIDLKMIIFSHAECQLGVGGYRMKYNGNKAPKTSIPEDFVDVAKGTLKEFSITPIQAVAETGNMNAKCSGIIRIFMLILPEATMKKI